MASKTKSNKNYHKVPTKKVKPVEKKSKFGIVMTALLALVLASSVFLPFLSTFTSQSQPYHLQNLEKTEIMEDYSQTSILAEDIEKMPYGTYFVLVSPTTSSNIELMSKYDQYVSGCYAYYLVDDKLSLNYDSLKGYNIAAETLLLVENQKITKKISGEAEISSYLTNLYQNNLKK